SLVRLWGSLASCAPVVNRPQATSLPHAYLVEILEDTRGAHAAPHAHRHNPVFPIPPFEFLDQRGGEFRPRASQRMPQRNRTAIHIDAVRRQTQNLDHGSACAANASFNSIR